MTDDTDMTNEEFEERIDSGEPVEISSEPVELTKEEKAYIAFMELLSKQSGNNRPSRHRLPNGSLATQPTLGQKRYRQRVKNSVAKQARKANR